MFRLIWKGLEGLLAFMKDQRGLASKRNQFWKLYYDTGPEECWGKRGCLFINTLWLTIVIKYFGSLLKYLCVDLVHKRSVTNDFHANVDLNIGFWILISYQILVACWIKFKHRSFILIKSVCISQLEYRPWHRAPYFIRVYLWQLTLEKHATR